MLAHAHLDILGCVKREELADVVQQGCDDGGVLAA
jgi:hypothetical protein